MRELFLRAAAGEWTHRPPVWMMRQAGRYLPEYRQIRENYTFREAISTPRVATEITLQPFERFSPDGVVMYSDILTALEPLGFDYHIESGVGPVIEEPITEPSDVGRPRRQVDEELAYVGELLDRLETRLGDAAAVLGFIGGPFTLACYAIDGQPAKTFMRTRQFRMQHPDAFTAFLDELTNVLVEFANYQIEAGADVIQLFDTYAGLLSPADYREFVLPRHREIVRQVDAPSIIFARNMGGNLALLAESEATVVGLDWTVDMETARATLGDRPVQGNLDPSYLYAPPEQIERRVLEIVEAAGPRGHILNLGHGVDKNTPIEGVRAFFDVAQSIERAKADV